MLDWADLQLAGFNVLYTNFEMLVEIPIIPPNQCVMFFSGLCSAPPPTMLPHLGQAGSQPTCLVCPTVVGTTPSSENVTKVVGYISMPAVDYPVEASRGPCPTQAFKLISGFFECFGQLCASVFSKCFGFHFPANLLPPNSHGFLTMAMVKYHIKIITTLTMFTISSHC